MYTIPSKRMDGRRKRGERTARRLVEAYISPCHREEKITYGGGSRVRSGLFFSLTSANSSWRCSM